MKSHYVKVECPDCEAGFRTGVPSRGKHPVPRRCPFCYIIFRIRSNPSGEAEVVDS